MKLLALAALFAATSIHAAPSVDACDAAAKALGVAAPYSCSFAATVTGAPAPAPVQTPAPAPAPMPPVVDHSGMGPTIDAKLIPAPAAGYAGPRVKTTFVDMTKWTDPTTGLAAPTCTGWSAHCAKGVPNPTCTAPSPATAPPTCVRQGVAPIPDPKIGAFRVPTRFAKMLNDDPIVFPGQPGVSHPHTFTGNAEVDAFSTAASIAGCKASTSDGGTLNCTSYWFPSMIDTGNGRPLVPTANVVYYKGSYDFDISKTVQALPAGLRMVAGNAKNTDPAKVGARYSCVAPGANSPWFSTITAAAASGFCKSGELLMSVPFPNCWDGVNLDSPNHASHMSGVVEDATGKHCPADHPVVIPVISYEIHYALTDAAMVGRMRLSSDMDPSLDAGITGHGDYFMGWDKKTMQSWIDGCLRAKFDCHADLLGNGFTLF